MHACFLPHACTHIHVMLLCVGMYMSLSMYVYSCPQSHSVLTCTPEPPLLCRSCVPLCSAGFGTQLLSLPSQDPNVSDKSPPGSFLPHTLVWEDSGWNSLWPVPPNSRRLSSKASSKVGWMKKEGDTHMNLRIGLFFVKDLDQRSIDMLSVNPTRHTRFGRDGPGTFVCLLPLSVVTSSWLDSLLDKRQLRWTSSLVPWCCSLLWRLGPPSTVPDPVSGATWYTACSILISPTPPGLFSTKSFHFSFLLNIFNILLHVYWVPSDVLIGVYNVCRSS